MKAALSTKSIALLTAKRAKKEAEKIAEKYGCKVIAAKSEVASLIKLSDIGNRELKEIEGSKLLLIPGYCSPSLAGAIERRTGTPTFLGPKNLANLPLVLEKLDKIPLSKTIPASDLIKDEIKRKAEKELEIAEEKKKIESLLKKRRAVKIGNVAISKEFPMRVVAEIANAGLLDAISLLEKARYYEKEGADIIALGFSGKAPEKVKKYVKYLRSRIALPIAVDTGSEREMRAALEADADLLMSFNCEMLSEFSSISKPCVIIPEADAKTAEEKLNSLKENIAFARKKKFTGLIADLILEPLNFGAVESITAYKKFDEEAKSMGFIPVLFGAGNVTELIDADSVGVNAVLAALAGECGASLLFTVEASDKCRGSVSELATASKMAYLARKRSSYPKDLGIDLLILKEKTKKERVPEIILKGARIIEAKESQVGKIALDACGDFVVFLKGEGEKNERKIFAVHFPRAGGKPDIVIKGKNAMSICRKITEQGLIKEVNHAMYLALELEKAEIALRTGRSYVQEERVF